LNCSTSFKTDFSALGAGENHTYDKSRPLTLKEQEYRDQVILNLLNGPISEQQFLD